MRSLIVVFLTGYSMLCSMWAQVIEFQRIGLGDGLSQVSVMDITQDKFGSIWLGTRNGLNRFDGKRIISYKTSKLDSSILENQIRQLSSQDSLLWIRTPNAISEFNLHTERFRSYPLPSLTAMQVEQDSIWVSTKTELFMLQRDSRQFRRIPLKLRENEIITSLCRYQRTLLIGTNMGVWMMLGSVQSLFLSEKEQVQSLFVDSKANVWVGTNNNGLIKMYDSLISRHFRGEIDISNDFVRCVEEDEDGRIWVGTFKGLDVIQLDGKITHYGHNKSLPTSLSHNSIWSLFRDRDGAMWAGTYFGGVNIFHPTRRIFTYYPENDVDHQSINFRVAGQVLEDDRHNLWICTDGGGLNYFDRSTETFTYYKADPGQNSISGNNVKSLLMQGDSVLWIGTHRAGLNRFNIQSGYFDHYMFATPFADSSRIPEIRTTIWYEDDLLVGTSAGLLRFDLETGTFSFFIPQQFRQKGPYSVTALWRDGHNEVWFGTEKSGLFRYNKSRQTFKSYPADRSQTASLPSDFIYAIFKDHAKRLWIGTSDGLSRYLPETDDFQSFYKEDGLSGNIIFGIVESRFSGLVIETDKGISYFNPETNSARNLTFANGLPLRELSPSGILNTSNGYLVVSGIEGMVIFHEMDFINQQPHTQPKVTSLLINNRLITPNRNPDIIQQTMMRDPFINLGHQHSSITFSISDMSYIASNRQGLEYKLDGFDEKWIEAGDRHDISYTNLDDGTYTFYVRSIHAPEYVTELSVGMRPPFYLSNWAMFLYTISGIGLLVLINFQYVRQSKLAYNLAAEKEHHLRDEELNQKKINFFTNISHEFRTPLTLMAGQLDLLLENPTFGPNTYKKLLSVQKNTIRLRNLISELLNFRKLEQGKLELKVKAHDFIVFIREIHASFTELAHHSHIDYTISLDVEELTLWFDQNQLEKVFYNLLANAFKFTPEGGQIILNLYQINEEIVTEVINTGSSIPQDRVDKIFDRFYQLDNIDNAGFQGTGIGLALAKGVIDAHKGSIAVSSSYTDNTTTFLVNLKKGNQHFAPETLATDTGIASLVLNGEEQVHPAQGFTESSETILIVEDNREMMHFLSELISPLFKVKKAANGKEAINIVQKVSPDLIVSDVLMPEMSGTEMCASLKNDILTSHIPIILLTAKGADEHRIEGLETGADDYIAKPFNTKVLLARINNILNNRRALQHKYSENPIQFRRKLAKKRIDKEFMEAAHSAVLRNIDNPSYNVELFAKDMALGRTNLFKKIKGITGQTPNEFIKGLRLNKAAQMMLLHPEKSIAEVAYASGFNNANYFSRAFKKKYNVSPVAYRSKPHQE